MKGYINFLEKCKDATYSWMTHLGNKDPYYAMAFMHSKMCDLVRLSLLVGQSRENFEIQHIVDQWIVWEQCLRLGWINEKGEIVGKAEELVVAVNEWREKTWKKIKMENAA